MIDTGKNLKFNSTINFVRKLNNWIKEGKEIKERTIQTDRELDEANGDKSRWRNEVQDEVSTLFKDKKTGWEFYNSMKSPTKPFNASFEFCINRFNYSMHNGIKYLEGLLDTVLLNEENKDKKDNEMIVNGDNTVKSKEVFIVHGRNSGIKETVAQFLSDLGLKPIILHEMPNKGRTIIEKFEDYSNVPFAIAIFTPDDKGCLNDVNEDLRARARQNVIFEFGYFIGKLGRKRACALIKGDIEKPSDYSGVIYIKFDKKHSWKTELIKELRTVYHDIDANKNYS